MQRKHLSIAFPAIVLSSAAVHQQVHLARQSRQRRHRHAPGIIFQYQPRNKNRVAQIRKWIVESLTRMNPPESIQVIFRIFADSHGCPILPSSLRTLDVATKDEPSRRPRPPQTCWRRSLRRAPRAPRRRPPKLVAAKVDGATAQIRRHPATPNARPHPPQSKQESAWHPPAHPISRR